MLSGLDAAIRLVTAPNSAFAQIRDNYERYFAWSVGIFVSSIFLSNALFALLDPDLADTGGFVLDVGAGLLAGIVFTAAAYLLGRLLGGNRNWRAVFSVLFYTNVLAFPLLAAFAALALLAGYGMMWPLIPSGQLDLEFNLLGNLGYLALLGMCIIAAMVWIVIVLVKAAKTVNGFGTAKAFGIIVLAFVASLAVAAPFNV